MKNRHILIARAAVLMLASTVFFASWGTSTLVGGISVFRTLGFATVGILVFNGLLSGRIAKLENTEISLALLCIWCFLSTLWSIDTNMSSSKNSVTLLAFLLFITTSRLSTKPTYWKLIGFFYVLGCVAASTTVLLNAASFAAGGQGDERATVGDLNANYIAYSLATSVPMALTLLNYQPHRWFVKLGGILFLPFVLSAVLLTGSRGALLAAGASIVLYFLLSVRKQYLFSAVSAAFALASLYFLFDYLPDSVQDRLGVFSSLMAQSDEAIDLTGREYVWPLAAKLFSENIISGIGFGAFRAANGEGVAVHNVLLTMATETGLIGLLLFVFTVAAIFRKIIFKALHPEIRKGGLLLLVTWLPIAMTGVWESSAVAWVAFGWYYGASFHSYPRNDAMPSTTGRRLSIRW